MKNKLRFKPAIWLPISFMVFSLSPLRAINASLDMKTAGMALQIPEPQKNLQNGKQYFVQLTSLSKSTDRLVDRFRKYAVYGDVYKLEVNGITKIRVGAFSDVNEAVAVMNLIKKNGAPDAFIVSESADQTGASVIVKSSAKSETVDTPKETENPAPAVHEEGKYKIRVAEYKAPDWFDVSKINDLGQIEHWTKSGWTIIVLGNYLTEDDAKMVIGKLKTRGFKESYIVVEENGKLFRL